MPILTVCMIVKNEAKNLSHCLASLQPIADHIVVVDTGSTDNTPNIAHSMGAHVYHFLWNHDFSAARNASLAHAVALGSDWVLIIDADEVLPESSIEPLQRLLDITVPTAYQLKIRNIADIASETADLEHYTVRLFPCHSALRFEGLVHEQLVTNDSDYSFQRLAVPEVVIVHHGYTQKAIQERNKYARNLDLLERSIQQEPQNAFHWFNLGLTYRGQKDIKTALESFQRAVALTSHVDPLPTYISACHGYILAIMIQYKDFIAAREYAEALPEVCRQNPDYWVNYGSLCCYLNETTFAINAFERALSMRGMHYPAMVSEPAARTWKPLAGLARAYLLEGNAAQAEHYYRQALQENPTHKGLQEQLLHLFLQRAPSSQSLVTLAHILRKNGNCEDALDWLECAFDQGDTSLALYNEMGQCFLDRQQYIEARNIFLLALQTYPKHPASQKLELAATLAQRLAEGETHV